MTRLLYLIILPLLLAQTAWGATKYVNNLGTDDASHGGSTGTGAYLSLEYALEDGLVYGGDIFIIEDASPTIFKSGTNNAIVPNVVSGTGDIIIQAANGVSVTIDIPSSTGSTFILVPISNSGRKFIVKDIAFTNTNSKAVSVFLHSTTGESYLRLENVSLDGNNANFFSVNANDSAYDMTAEFYRCTFANTAYGVYKNPKVTGNKMTVTFQSCLINHVSRIQHSSAATAAVNLNMYNNTVVKLLTSALLGINGTGNTLNIKNNIFVASSAEKLLGVKLAATSADFIANPSYFNFKNNVVFQETIADSTSLDCIGISYYDYDLLPIDESNHYINPNFVNAASDFHISASDTSYISGKGAIASVPALDRDGNAFKGADIGCYTNPSSAVNTPALTRKVAFVGDSIMVGVFTSGQYVPPVGWSIIGNTPEVEWTPSESRAAIGGLKVSGTQWLIDRVMVEERPKIVYVSAGVNNGSPYLASASPTNLTAQQLTDALVVIMKKVRGWGGFPIYLGLEPQSGANLALQVQFANEVNALMATACISNGWRYGSILDYMIAKNANWNTVYYDDITTNVHPNETGHGVIAELALSLHPKQSDGGGNFGNMNFSLGW